MQNYTLSAVRGTGAGVSQGGRRFNVVVLVAILLACAVPFGISDYWVFQLTLIVANSIALLGLNLLTGYNGQISLGHSAFYAIGAYTTAILMDKFNVPYALTIPLSGLLCFGAGYAFGKPALRLAGIYLALATFALGVCLPQLLKYKHAEHWTGGVQGISVLKPDAPFGLPLSPDHWLFLLAFAIMLGMFYAARNLLAGHTGAALIAIRDNPIAAAAMGIDIARYKTITFGISALYTGVAGSLTTLAIQFVAPDSFHSGLSITFLVGIVVGGLASIPGAIYGAIFIQFLPLIAEKVSKAAPQAISGVLLIACVYALPYGIAGLITKLAPRFSAAKTP